MADQFNETLTVLTVQLISAFLANATVRPDELPGLIASVKSALALDPGIRLPSGAENSAESHAIPKKAGDLFAQNPSAETSPGSRNFGVDYMIVKTPRPVVSFEPREPRLPDSAPVETQTRLHKPAVSLEKSLSSPHVILSMLNGKPYKSLKSHLTRAGLTPEDYRARYDLPVNYPMTAPSYSAQRSDQAKRLGYGRKPSATQHRARLATPHPAPATTAHSGPAQAKRPRGRPRKDAIG